MKTRIHSRAQLGTLLLDSLTAIAILAIIFAITYPNYARARYEAAVAIDVQQMDAINTATTFYGNEHNYAYPTGTISGTNPGSNYLPANPTSPIGPSGYAYGTTLNNSAPYVIVDQNWFTTAGAGTAHDITLLNNYKQINGAACISGDYLAYDIVHGVFCAATSNG